MQTGNTNFTYKIELDKACYQHDMAYGKSKDLLKRTQPDNISRDKAFKIANDPKIRWLSKRISVLIKNPSCLINLVEVVSQSTKLSVSK